MKAGLQAIQAILEARDSCLLGVVNDVIHGHEDDHNELTSPDQNYAIQSQRVLSALSQLDGIKDRSDAILFIEL